MQLNRDLLGSWTHLKSPVPRYDIFDFSTTHLIIMFLVPIKQHPLNADVQLTQLSNEESSSKLDLYSYPSVFLFPSWYLEGWGTILKQMAFGDPSSWGYLWTLKPRGVLSILEDIVEFILVWRVCSQRCTLRIQNKICVVEEEEYCCHHLDLMICSWKMLTAIHFYYYFLSYMYKIE